MFLQSIRAGLPLIYAHTDDIINVETAVKACTTKRVLFLSELPEDLSVFSDEDHWDTPVIVTLSVPEDQRNLYIMAMKYEKTVVAVNIRGSVGFDAGMIPIPQKEVRRTILKLCTPDEALGIEEVLAGMSLKMVREAVLICAANGGMSLDRLRMVRRQLMTNLPGIEAVESLQGFYAPDSKLETYIHQSRELFLDCDVPLLQPRGVLLHGKPGCGKTAAAKYIASEIGVPLYRLNIGAGMSKWQGESEQNLRRGLAQIDTEAPCVLLIDEVEKNISTGDDAASAGRMLSEILWWLAEHTTKVFTVMTCNNLAKLPPELYRAGRLDKTIEIGDWNTETAKTRAINILVSLHISAPIHDAVLEQLGSWPVEFPTVPADVRQLVVDLVKEEVVRS